MSTSTDPRLSALLLKYSAAGPYYTSYPTGKKWSDHFTSQNYQKMLDDMIRSRVPLSLYIHFPFCARRCRFCFCYTTVTADRSKIRAFLKLLKMEIVLLRDALLRQQITPAIKEVHLGGGSPSFMEAGEFILLTDMLQMLADPQELAEFTLETDAVTVTREKLHIFADHGVNRISLGIQDFDPRVQKAIGRIQSPALIGGLLTPELRSRFKSVNFDLMYGLPLQTRQSFRKTIDATLELSPDRIALYNYCHMPQIYPHQSALNAADFPDDMEKLMIFLEASRQLNDRDYASIGIDHFAKASEELTVAKNNGTLCRHFMGYTAGRAPHVLGLGPSSLSGFTDHYAQNRYSLEDYARALDAGDFPVFRGYSLNDDDIIRRGIIHQLLCYFSIDLRRVEHQHKIDFWSYFETERPMLQGFIDDGIVTLSGDFLKVVYCEKLFVRHVCAIFDRYARDDAPAYVPVLQRSGHDGA